MERVPERADFHLALWDREAGEDRLHDGQGHPRGHDREGQPETDQEADVEESRRHSRGDPAAHDRDGVHDRGHVRRDEQPAPDARQDHRQDQRRIGHLVGKDREPEIRDSGHEESAGGEEPRTVLVGEVAAEGTDAHEGEGERDQEESRRQRIEPERPLEVEHEDEADGPLDVDARRLLRTPAEKTLFRNKARSIIGDGTARSTGTNAKRHATPASNRTRYSGAQPVIAPRVTPRRASDKPPAKRRFPAGSSFSRPGRAPSSLRRAYAQIVANTPKGTLIQKIDCQPRRAVRTPPATRPLKAPAVPATWLSPSARPRSETGNASGRIAALVANKSPAPMPWTSRNRTRLVPFGARLHRPDPIVKIAI